MVSLTPKAEKLLRENLNDCQRYKGHDSQYLEKRFNRLSLEDEILLQIVFKEPPYA